MALQGLHLFLLIMAVPTQYFLTYYMAPVSTDREFLTRTLLQNTINSARSMLDWNSWKTYVNDIVERVISNDDLTGECVAVEVFKYKEPNGYFSASPKPRTDRTGVKFRVGQVIKHAKFGYKGVIIGWDKTAQAPAKWLQINHQDPTHRSRPNYSVLVDIRDRTDVQTTYVVEENIVIVADKQVDHPEIPDYFSHYDGTMYQKRGWLKEVYPND